MTRLIQTSFLCSQRLIDGWIDIADNTSDITAFLIITLNNMAVTVCCRVNLTKNIDHRPSFYIAYYRYKNCSISTPVSTTEIFIVVEICRKVKKIIISCPKILQFESHILEHHNRSLAMITVMLVTFWDWQLCDVGDIYWMMLLDAND